MVDTCSIWLPDAKSTYDAGVSLASTLYRKDSTIGLKGDLGAGKTTFLQGFFNGLGIDEPITSPTYALEQRYTSATCDVIHIDVYRLQTTQIDEFLHGTEEHSGIRCIEWIDKSSIQPDILIHLQDKEGGRLLHVEFNDMALPSNEMIYEWRKEVALPDVISAHCDAVALFIQKLSDDFIARQIIHRPQALICSALVHDLLRFIDFKPGAGHEADAAREPKKWKYWKEKFKNFRHEQACAILLQERGYPELASIVAVHGCMSPSPIRKTIEQQLLFYADKRIMSDTVVSVEQRFDDFKKRYTNGKHTQENDIWLNEVKALEHSLKISL